MSKEGGRPIVSVTVGCPAATRRPTKWSSTAWMGVSGDIGRICQTGLFEAVHAANRVGAEDEAPASGASAGFGVALPNRT